MLIYKHWKFYLSLAVFVVLAGALLFWDFVLGTAGNVGMEGNLNMNSYMIDMGGNGFIKNLRDLLTTDHSARAANKGYVDKNILQNRTGSDPSDAVVGQMWLRTDQ